MITSKTPWWIGPALTILVFGGVGGVAMAIWTDNLGWLLLTVLSFIILYAG